MALDLARRRLELFQARVDGLLPSLLDPGLPADDVLTRSEDQRGVAVHRRERRRVALGERRSEGLFADSMALLTSSAPTRAGIAAIAAIAPATNHLP